jgi:hypothetical protein
MNTDLMFSSKTDEHNTPRWLAERITWFFGAIGLDPATDASNPVGATQFYAPPYSDGLALPWPGTVYLNPPYGRGIDAWMIKLVQEYREGRTLAAITLLPARTDTQWWGRIADYPVCFFEGRLKFNDCETAAPFPSALVYLGPDNRRFCRHFSPLGRLYMPIYGS